MTRPRTVTLRKSNLFDARQELRFKRWKLIICNLINIPVLHRYNFVYNIEYIKGRLDDKDLIVDRKGVIFMVITASNGLATIVTHEAYSEQPKMHGVFTLIDRSQLKKE